MGSWGTLASARQLEVEQSAAYRAELKDVILKFLGVASRVQKAALARSGGDGGQDGGGVQEGRLDELAEELWLAQAEIDLAARTESLRGATYRYAFRLAEAARGDDADAATLRGVQAEFMDAAYDDLWPGRQRVTAPGDLGRNT
ncbi:hypothetical protein ABZ622_30210 [Streptomyces sp. NPDC007164]|uniref:hypothetical protein n=1 Tax=Streptomyces sp. NPDC007164 TaxID=3156918 RepID=UPI003408C05A